MSTHSVRQHKSVTKRLVIGLVADDTIDKPDGVQQYVQILGRWFAAQGHEVHYIVGQSSRTDFPNVHSMSKNVHVRFNGNRVFIPLPASRRRIRQLFETTQFDVLHVMTPHSPFMAQRVVMQAPKTTAVVGTFHILPHTRMVAVLTHVLGLWLRPSLRRMHTIFAVSPAAQEFADRSFRITTKFLPNVVDVHRFMDAKPLKQYADRPTIVRIDRLVVRKGAQYLAYAAKYIVDHQLYTKPFRVVIGGKGEQYDMLQHYITDNNLQDVIELTGYIPEEEKPRYIASSDIAVYPATSGESFGIVLLEGMAGSKGPTLGGNNPGYSSVLGSHPEQLFNPKDTPNFARLLVSYLNNAQARQAAAQWQQRAIIQYDMSVVGEKLLAAYTEALHDVRSVQ